MPAFTSVATWRVNTASPLLFTTRP
jgi:hypothetical protein